MYMTVEDALTVYPLSEGSLVAGRAGLRRIVKSVNVMDAPDIADWVHEGEVLFTTAYLLKDHPEEGAALIDKLARKGAAALGIKLGRFWTEIPQVILQEADRTGLPVIQLPYPFTFSDQMNGLFRAEMTKTTSMLKQIVEKQQALMRFALGKPQLPFYEQLAAILGFPMAVVSADKQMLFSSLAVREEELLGSWPWKPRYHTLRSQSGKLAVYPLTGRQGEPAGFAVFQWPREFMSKEEECLFSQAADVIAHHLEEQALTKREHKDSELVRLVQCYLKQQVSLEAVLECAGSAHAGFIQGPFQCLLTFPSAAQSGHLPVTRSKAVQSILHEFQYHPRLKELAVLHAEMESGLVSIVPCPQTGDEQRLPKLLNQLFARPGEEQGAEAADTACRFAVSRLKQNSSELSEAYQECLDAAGTAEKLKLQQLVVEYRNLDFADLFSSLSPGKMRHFASRMLAPVLEKSPEAAEEMLNTLRLYLLHNGQTAEAAKELFVHRNTAAYRLDKISELLQVDLRSYEHLLKLKLALLFQEFLDQESGSA